MKGGNVSEPTGWPRPATPCDLVPAWAGEFDSFGDWVSFATARLPGAIGSVGQEVSAICVDAKGRRCHVGADFMRARDEDAFPVRYFWEMRQALPECDGGGAHCCCCGPGDACCDCGSIMPAGYNDGGNGDD